MLDRCEPPTDDERTPLHRPIHRRARGRNIDEDDPLYSLQGQRDADRRLKEVFTKMGVPNRYRGSFYPGPHKFDRPMQAEAFAWFDRWLKG